MPERRPKQAISHPKLEGAGLRVGLRSAAPKTGRQAEAKVPVAMRPAGTKKAITITVAEPDTKAVKYRLWGSGAERRICLRT